MSSFDLEDVYVVEGEAEATMEEYYYSIQRAINSGSAWKFQGSYGRSMMDAINAGAVLLGRTHGFDYYGNLIPSRDMVKKGTKGSFEYVVANYGKTWAKKMKAL